MRVIGLTWIEHNSRLLALPGSGIESAADLRGKRLRCCAARSARDKRVRPRLMRITHTHIVTHLLTTLVGRVNMYSTLTDRWSPS